MKRRSSPKGPLDAEDTRLKVGDPVVSTVDYDENVTYTGRVVALRGGLIVEILRSDGSVRRVSSRLWKLVRTVSGGTP